jgi:exopolyphosphatase/guanosine-5'-triphosphate,3'-diphosphate pyrophosphatase
VRREARGATTSNSVPHDVRRACIDIGSNTTRLLVAECGGSRLLEVHQERSFTKIGRDLRADGTIGPEKIAEVCRVVSAQLRTARELGAVDVRCVATASIRRAHNGEQLADAIRARCDGLRVEILSGEAEARLAFIGVAAALDREPPGPLAVVDVGGGSCELVVGQAPSAIIWWVSLPIGSGDLAAQLQADPPSSVELASARSRAEELLVGLQPPETTLAVAVGGSATSLRRLAGPALDNAAFERALQLLATNEAQDLARRFALDVNRVRLLPAGITLLRAVSELFGSPLLVGRGGLREGVLLSAGQPHQ